MGCLVRVAIRDLEGRLGLGDFLEALVLLEELAKQDYLELLEPLVSKELLVTMVSQACRVSQAIQACPAHKDLEVCLDQEGRPVLQVLPAQPDPQETSVRQEPMASRVQPGRGDPTV